MALATESVAGAGGKRASIERKPPKAQRRQGSLQVAHYPILLQHNQEVDHPSVTWKTSWNGDVAECWPDDEEEDDEAIQGSRATVRRASAVVYSSHGVDGTGCVTGNGAPPSMLVPSPTHKFSLNTGQPPFRPNSASSTQLSTAARQELWHLAPTAFHQSFDGRARVSNSSLSNSCSHLDDQEEEDLIEFHQQVEEEEEEPEVFEEEHWPVSATSSAGIADEEQYRIQRKRRTAFSGSASRGGAFAYAGGSGCNSAAGYPCGSSRPALGGRSPQSSFESNGDVGQISMNLMRVNGTMAPFKGLLQSLPSTASAAGSSPACNQENTHPTLNSKVSSASHIGRLESLRRLHHNNSSEESKRGGHVDIDVDLLGDQSSRKSLSLVLSEDVEGQRNGGGGLGAGGNQDDSETPLMKDQEQNFGGRLIQRQQLYDRRRVAADYALFFAVLGIILMILESELSAAHLYEKGSLLSVTLKSIVLLSTALLLVLVGLFHIIEIQLFMNANSAEDWRIALTCRRILQVFLENGSSILQIVGEMTVCAICPIPFDFRFPWSTSSIEGRKVTSYVYVDVWLSIPMFLRLYWLCRVMLLHSRLFTDASSRSIAGLNRVNFNARFILKTLMTLCPGTMLMMFTVSLWVMAGWILRLCERQEVDNPSNPKLMQHNNYLNSLWMIAITFLSVGYGDIVPHTYCGRTMAVITGILGTCTSSMVVAVIARKLELTRAEKHVHNFMMDTQLTKQLKHSAANVLRETWLIYKYRRLVDKPDPGRIRQHQRKFLVAIYQLRKVKRDQRKLAENLVSLGDVAKTSSNTYEMVHDVQSTQEGLSMRMTAIEHQLSDISRELAGLAQLIREERRNSATSELSDTVRRRKP